MPDSLAELRALVTESSAPPPSHSPLDELRSLVTTPDRIAVDASPTPDELEVIAGAPPNRPAFSLKPSAIPSPDVLSQPLPPARLGSAKTGGGATALQGTFPVLDAPHEGIPQMGRGAAHLVTGEGGRMNAASDLIEGGMKTLEPAMVAGALVNPIATLAGLVGGVGGQQAASAGVEALGGSSEASRLAGNVTGLVTGGMAAHGAGVGKARIMEALRPPVAVDTPLEVTSRTPNAAEPPLEVPTRDPIAAGSPIEELQQLVEPEPSVAEAQPVSRVSPEPEVAPTEPAAPSSPVEELRTLVEGEPDAETVHPTPEPAVPEVVEADAHGGSEGAAPPEDGGVEAAQPEAAESAASPQRADLDDAHLKEIRRIVHELDAMGYTDTTWNDLSSEGGINDGNAGGGGYNRRPAVGGAKVYDDIYQMAPGSSKATRAAVQAQLERYLAGGKPTQAVKGAIEIARLRMEGKARIPGDGKLSSPELPPSAGEVPTRLESKPSFAEEGLPTEELSDDAHNMHAEGQSESDVEDLGDWFKQQANAGAEPPAADAEASNPIEELARLINAQPKVAEAPFSLASEAAEPTEVQSDLFKPEKPKFGEWQKSQAPKGDVTLQSTLVPGAKEFAEQDLAPIARGVGRSAREIKNALSPQTASPEAQSTADTVREAKARVANAGAIEQAKYAKVEKTFSKASDAENIANISRYERTGTFANAPAGYSEFYRKSMSESRAMMQHAYGDDAVGLIDNYVRRAFKFGTPKDEQAGTTYLTNRTRTLSANRTPLKGRVLDMPLDEALADMQKRGIKVQMATTNPELLRQWSMTNARQAAAFKEAWQQMKEGGLVTFVKMGDRLPEGLVPVDERGASLFYPKERGLGQYYADANVARVLNNATSRGIGGSATYQGLRAINNSMNQLQLGLSGFHATGTAINAGISDLALGVRRFARGDVKGGAAAAARSAVPGLSFARDMWRGRNLIEGLKADSPEAYKVLDEHVNPSGARLHIDQRYSNQALEKMRTAFANSNYIGAAARMPLALVEQVAKPLMSYAIPRVKIGALLDLAEDIQSRMSDATPAERARKLAAASDSIDNRFGQLVHDNLFWNKTAADLSQLATRSVGWNLGTVREIGGGLLDARKLAHGEVSDRLLYTAALPVYVGMIGAVYQYLHTGEKPSEVKDYFYPKNGRTEPNGMVSRTTLPTYMKDVEAYASHPLDTIGHKQSPLLDFTETLVRNEDYFGNLIRNPDDPAMQQLQQLGSFALREIAPFSVQQLQRSNAEHATAEGKAESFLGFVKAPASMERTPAETMMHDFIGPQPGGRTPEQVDKADTKRELRQDIKQGDTAATRAIIDKGQVGRRSIMDAARSANLTGLQAGFRKLTLDQALRVYEVATPAQRGALRLLLSRKVGSLRDEAPADVADLQKRLTKAGQLPFSPPPIMAALQPAK